MITERLHKYCLSKIGVTEAFPFDENTLVLKVMDKIFLLADIQEPKCSINLKCNPEWALELRASYPAVQPGYHMNKKHWNTVEVDGSIPDEIVLKMIDHSYSLVVNGLTKKDKAILAEMTNSSNL